MRKGGFLLFEESVGVCIAVVFRYIWNSSPTVFVIHVSILPRSDICDARIEVVDEERYGCRLKHVARSECRAFTCQGRVGEKQTHG